MPGTTVGRSASCRRARLHTQQWPVQPVQNLSDVFVVRTVEEAEYAVSVLQQSAEAAAQPHAWDTEVAALDVSKQSPVGNGTLLCMSCYAGPSVSFGARGVSRLWVDCWGEDGVPEAADYAAVVARGQQRGEGA